MLRAMDDTLLHAVRTIYAAEQSLRGSGDGKSGTGTGIFTGILGKPDMLIP
ncbi:hypothetical protein GGE65_006251 [Skermanella aerolata]|uniref:hypothetical protein n=1 Tax=Skermanella aerolata TaxID=393310 RepID=UPI003D1D063B